MSQHKFATIAAQHGICSDDSHGAVVPPLYLSTNYTFEEFGKPRQYDYSRSGNPTRSCLADTLAQLDAELASHGRGIKMTESAFDLVRYNTRGNQVVLVKYFRE